MQTVQTPLPDVIDICSPTWPSLAFKDLKKFGCARLKLEPCDNAVVDDLYDAMERLSNDRTAQDQVEVPDAAFDNLDQRNGYVWDKHREIFELHPQCANATELSGGDSSTARSIVQCAWDYCDMCEMRCLTALEEVIAEFPLVRDFLGADKDQQLGAGVIENMLRVYRYNKTYDKPDGDIDAHFDMGLFTIIPKSTSPGLMIQPSKSSQWCSVEESLKHGEALLFGGLTLARLTGVPALRHGVFTSGRTRFSAPYFQRVAPHCVLPASLGHKQEKVSAYNRRLRQAENDELREDGSIEWRQRRRDSRSRSNHRQRDRHPLPSRGVDDKSKEATRDWSPSGDYATNMENSNRGRGYDYNGKDTSHSSPQEATWSQSDGNRSNMENSGDWRGTATWHATGKTSSDRWWGSYQNE